MKTIALIFNTSKVCYYFRRELISDLIKSNYKVIVIAGDDMFKNEIVSLGVDFLCAPLNNRSINFFKSLSYQKTLTKFLKRLKPDIVFTFQIKPIVFGNAAAKKASIPFIFSMIEGLGDGFSRSSFKYFLAEMFLSIKLKQALKKITKCFVMNKEDIEYLQKNKILNPSITVLINETGIDPNEYPYADFQCFNRIVMISRLIKAKGVMVFCEAARRCKQINPSLVFSLIGYESDISKRDLIQYIEDGSVDYLGVVPNLHPTLREMSIFVLPTYYNEGFPRCILEAMSTGRPVITTDNKGGNVAVKDGVNGYLVEKQSVDSLVDSIIKLSSNHEKMIEFGKKGREMVETLFDSKTINNFIISFLPRE